MVDRIEDMFRVDGRRALVTSRLTATHFPPSARISSTRPPSFSARRAATTTSAPA